MDKNNKTAEAMVGKFVKMNWDHEYAENGVLSKDDAVLFANTYASLQSSEKDERIKELEEEIHFMKEDLKVEVNLKKTFSMAVDRYQERIEELERLIANQQQWHNQQHTEDGTN